VGEEEAEGGVMSYDLLISIILAAIHDDWLRNESMNTLKRDLNVTVRQRLSDEPEYFDAPWATRLGHERPRIHVYELWYAASFVQAFYFASVDGGRAELPLTESRENLTITRLQFSIALAVNDNPGRLQEYLQGAEIHIKEQ
jgi:hypothetical protein